MLRYVPNAEESRCFQPSKMKEFEVDFWRKMNAVEMQSREAEATRDFRYDCENFAGIAKISQS